MAIKRYVASKDTTITNAFRANLSTRGTGSNMGASDVLETFSIFAQANTGSSELSRILIQFPTSDISTDRTATNIPASGSVSFYMRMFNVAHGTTLPKNFTLSARPVTKAWQEGDGIDMNEYRDETYDLLEGANWDVAQSGSSGAGIGVAATLADAIDTTGVSADPGDAFTMTVPAAAGGDGVAHKFTMVADDAAVDALTPTTGFGVSAASTGGGVASQVAAAIIDAINGTSNDAVGYGGGAVETVLEAGTLGVTAAEGSSDTQITLTMSTAGADGNVANVLAANTGFEDALLLEATFTGGLDLASWTTVGGDYETDSNYVSYTQTFSSGTENLEINITSLVEEWLAGTRTNYGVGVHLTGSSETVSKSYYTKKFFSRTSEFFFKRPVIEARWDSTKKDNRSNFYLSSALAPANDNVNTLYLYNYVRGQLKNIPDIGTGVIYVSIHSGTTSPGTYVAGENPVHLASGGGRVATGQYATGGYVEAGVYSASVVVTGTVATDYYYYDVWSSGQGASGAPAITYYTGSAITPTSYAGSNMNPSKNYTTNIKNMKRVYAPEETARLRVSIRDKNWSPNIYTAASTAVSNTIIDDAYYKIYRIIDDLEIIRYGTGSVTPQTLGSSGSYTRLSHDISGNYFDLDIAMLESGYTYGIKLCYYNTNDYQEQPEIFKFRVEKLDER